MDRRNRFVRVPGKPRSPLAAARQREIGEGVDQYMAGVRVKENEPIEVAIRRFKKQCEKAGILSELRKREHFEKPSVRRKKKSAGRQEALSAAHDARGRLSEPMRRAGAKRRLA